MRWKCWLRESVYYTVDTILFKVDFRDFRSTHAISCTGHAKTRRIQMFFDYNSWPIKVLSKFPVKEMLSFWRKRGIWRNLNHCGRNGLSWYSCCCPVGLFCFQRRYLEIEWWMLNWYQLVFGELITFSFSFFFPPWHLEEGKPVKVLVSMCWTSQLPKCFPLLLETSVCFPEKGKALLFSFFIHI